MYGTFMKCQVSKRARVNEVSIFAIFDDKNTSESRLLLDRDPFNIAFLWCKVIFVLLSNVNI